MPTPEGLDPTIRSREIVFEADVEGVTTFLKVATVHRGGTGHTEPLGPWDVVVKECRRCLDERRRLLGALDYPDRPWTRRIGLMALHL